MQRTAWWLLFVFGASGCEDEGVKVGATASASASASASLSPPAACSATGPPGAGFSIGQPTRAGEDHFGLPFAVELGGAVALRDGFAVGALRDEKDGTHALVALVPADADGGRIIDLGKTHGDVVPPQLAADGTRVLVAVADNDAGGMRARLARVDTAAPGSAVSWGRDVPHDNDESPVFGIAASAGRAALVWDEWNRDGGYGLVRAVGFETGDLTSVADPVALSAEKADSEAPRIWPRPGGFWVAWITNGKIDPEAEPARGRAATMAIANRWVTIRPVDRAGRPAGEPIDATSREGSVLTFDLATGKDGAALIATREDTTSPSTAGGTVRVVRVRPDGTVEAHPVDVEDVGAGVPALLVDPEPAGKPFGWLALADSADSTSLVPLGGDGRPAPGRIADPLARTATPLAVREGGMLLARPRGKAIELGVVMCRGQVKDDVWPNDRAR